MKKNTLIYILIFAVLTSVAVWLLSKNEKSTLPKALSDFSVSDTGSITLIKMSNRNGANTTLERKSGSTWIVNGKFKAQKSMVDILLETMRLVDVKNPVPLSARDNVVRDLASTATKVEIYQGEDLIKTYFVGGTTSDELGTYMLIQGSSEPFVTHIPGFYGFLNSRYQTNPNAWHSSEVYHLDPSTITSIELNYPLEQDASFRLTVENNEFYVQQLPEGKKQKMKPLAAKKLLAGFRTIDFEQFADLTPDETDSILRVQPAAIIKVEAETANPPLLTLYPKKADERTKQVGGDGYDMDRFYGTINNGKEIVLVQSFVVGKILQEFQDMITQ